MDLRYEHVSGSTYKIICVAYGDCGPLSVTAFNHLFTGTPEVCVYDGNTYITTLNLTIQPPDSGENIAKYVLCAHDKDSTTCTNTAYPYPGVKKFTYAYNYTVPYASHNWRFIYDGNMLSNTTGRAIAITNISSSPVSVTALIDTLDNTFGTNSSPQLSVEPIPYFCDLNSDSYNPIALDPDVDSLRFDLVPGYNGSQSCGSSTFGFVSYLSSYSGANPLAVVPGSMTFDNKNGQINFTPNMLQRSLVVYNIEEYRYNGATGTKQLVGTSMREMNFIVLNCTNNPPAGITMDSVTNGSVSSDSLHFNVCQNSGPFSIFLDPYETDTSVRIKVDTLGFPSGCTISVTNDSTSHPHCVVSWTSTGIAPGSYTFYIKFIDDHCPVHGVSIQAYTVNVLAFSPIVGPASLCTGTTMSLSDAVTGGTWSSGNVAIATVGTSSGIVTGIAPGVTNITYTMPGGCHTIYSITVAPLAAIISGSASICVGTTSALTITATGGTWSSSNSAIASIGATSGIVTGVSIGTANITYMITGGCFCVYAVTINPYPAPIAGSTTVCQGSAITLTDASSGGGWSSSNPSMASVTTGGVVTGILPGTVTIGYFLGSCGVSKTIIVKPSPAIISGGSSLCNGSSLTLTDATTGGAWSSGDIALATIDTDGIVQGISPGTLLITYTAGGCYVTKIITVNALPGVIGGNLQACVGLQTTLSETPAGGTWTSNNSGIATITTSGGVVTGVTTGIVTITYTTSTGCGSATTNITVNPIPAQILPSTALCPGATITLSDPTTGGKWSCSNTSLATVDSNTGVVTGVYGGNPIISYTVILTGCYTTAIITVSPASRTSVVIHATPGDATHDTICTGTFVNFSITDSFGGSTPTFQWSVNWSPVGSGATSYSYIPYNGDIVMCKMYSTMPCPAAYPAIAIDTMVVKDFHQPTLFLSSSGGIKTCQGAPVTITAFSTWSGWGPIYSWSLNGSVVGGGDQFTYTPSDGDTIKCTMLSNYYCDTPIYSDTAMAALELSVDPIIHVVVSGRPGALLSVGGYDTLVATVFNGGNLPHFQWKVNGMPLINENDSILIRNDFVNGDSVSCEVTTGSGTPCEGIIGFHWMILVVGQLGGIQTEADAIDNFELLPNPNNGEFIIQGNGSKKEHWVRVRITDVIGREVYKDGTSVKNGKFEKTIHLRENIESGIYLMQLTGEFENFIVRFSIFR